MSAEGSDRQEFWRAQLAAHLAGLLGEADAVALAELEAEAGWVALRSGELLFRRGDPGDAAYIVLSGRLRAVDDSAGERLLNEVGAGETLGEMAVLSAEPRSATVYAVRDSLLARLPAAAFQRLVDRHPRILRRVSALLIERLRRRESQPARPHAVVRTLTVVPTGASPLVSGFAARLAAALAAHGPTLHLDARRADPSLGDARLVQWLNEQELAHRFVLYEADPSPSAWSERAVRQADHVLFVADASASPRPGELERALAERWRGAHAPRRSLVLLRPTGGPAPCGTAAFLEGREVDCHYHVAADFADDYARLARCLAGAGIGLVLGGGGARGFAHLGVLLALAEAGVALDWFGGTSVGAIVAALAAQGLSPGQAHAQCKAHFSALRDPTLPLVSLIAGRRIRAKLESVFGASAIEDLPLPYHCVSTNLSRAAQVVHERGPLVRAIRASIGLPGILPPVGLAGDLHVDGGLVNNLPIDVMAARPEIGTVIAVDVSAEVEMRAPQDLGLDLSGWRVLWHRFTGGAAREVPSIMSLLTRSALAASVYWGRERRLTRAASLYLRVPLADLRLLAFERIDEIVARGYQAVRERVLDWQKARAG
ncbi:MAG TPA: cyclic nucleotide-binding and patatin-like phospholipase domain-containing protein [Burkholderiales bacterium]|nr:cyclic nucleotide-binding and patatin-like phospholipase domain-containing protein [Burkholderiales bacterium]